MMSQDGFAAGAAAVDIHHLGAADARRRGQIDLPPWPQQLRCLVLAHADPLVVVFNADWGRWPKLLAETRQVVEAAVPGRQVEVLCFANQANHNLDYDGVDWWGGLDPKHPRHDPHHRAQLLQAIQDVFTAAWQNVRPATIALGRGRCDSISVNCYWGEGHTDPTVAVLRIADDADHLIAVLVNYACRSHDAVWVLSGGMAGALAATVQKIYGPVPVFFFNGGSGDHFPALREPPQELREAGLQAFDAARAELFMQEYDRIGRVLGGEVCKVLAELEVAGQPLLAQNERWRYTSWIRYTDGLRIAQPMAIVHALEICLWYVPLPPVETCQATIEALDKEIRARSKTLPYPPRNYAPMPLDPHETSSDLYRLMELGSARKYWGIAAGRAKWERRYQKTRQVCGEIKLLVLSPEVAVICMPASMCFAVVATLKAQSPFPVTLIWDCLGPWNLGFFIPEAEGALGGAHRGICDYAQEAIDQMVGAIVDALQTLYHEVRIQEPAAPV